MYCIIFMGLIFISLQNLKVLEMGKTSLEFPTEFSAHIWS